MNPLLQPTHISHGPTAISDAARFTRKRTRVGTNPMTIWAYYLVMCLLGFPLLCWFAIPNVPLEQEALAYTLFLLCTIPVVTHLTGKDSGLPVFPIINLVYGASFAMPIFFSQPLVVTTVNRSGLLAVSNTAVMYALELSVIGVASMQVAFWFFRFSLLHLLVPRMSIHLKTKKAKKLVSVLAVVGLVLSYFTTTLIVHIPSQFSYTAVLISRQTILCLALYYLYHLKGELTSNDKMWFIAVLTALEVMGLASGNLRAFLDPPIVLGAVYWMYRRRFPWVFAAVAGFFFFLIQPVKAEFRERVWFEAYAERSIIGRMELWVDLATARWSHVFEKGHGAVQGTTRAAAGRTDMIHMFARAAGVTPRYVPYQYGKTYSYLLYALIPRAFWPEKPPSQTANAFFGVAYDFQTAEGTDITSIGLPHLVEAYINFGIVGLPFVMALIGMIYAAVDRLFNHPNVGEGGLAIYAIVLPSLVTVETATAPTFGALIQSIIVYWLVFRFVVDRSAGGKKVNTSVLAISNELNGNVQA